MCLPVLRVFSNAEIISFANFALRGFKKHAISVLAVRVVDAPRTVLQREGDWIITHKSSDCCIIIQFTRITFQPHVSAADLTLTSLARVPCDLKRKPSKVEIRVLPKLEPTLESQELET